MDHLQADSSTNTNNGLSVTVTAAVAGTFKVWTSEWISRDVDHYGNFPEVVMKVDDVD